MSKRNRSKASSEPTNELEALLEGVDGGAPEGLLAEACIETMTAEDTSLAEHDALLETLATEDLPSADDLLESLEHEMSHEGATNDPVITITTGVDKQAIYDEQTSTLQTASPEDAAPVPRGKQKGKKAKKQGGEQVPGGDVPKITVSGGPRSATLSAKANIGELTKLGFTEAEIPELVERIDALPKKVGEKGYNLIRFAAGRESLSNYTRFAIEVLRDHGPMSVPDLVKRMVDRNWSVGTARSQSQQMSRLFTAYDMVEKADGKIGLNRDNPFVKNILDRLPKR